MFYVLNESRNDKANTILVGRMMKKIGVQESGGSGMYRSQEKTKEVLLRVLTYC